MQEINKDSLSSLNNTEFSILLFYANGCHHCEKIKPVFELLSSQNPQIGFYKSELNNNIAYYNKYAEDTQEMSYESLKNENGEEKRDQSGNTQIVAVPQFNKDNTPKMIKKLVIPGFYVHHIEAKSPENEYGFIGGWEGSEPTEIIAVLDMINKFKANG